MLARIAVLLALAIPQAALDQREFLTEQFQAQFGHTRQVHVVALQGTAESGWRTGRTSPVGARGPFQFMPPTERWVREQHRDLRDQSALTIQGGIMYAVRYDRMLYRSLRRFQDECDHWTQVLAAYNWGIGSLLRARRTHGAAWLQHAPRETRNYVAKIWANETPYLSAGFPGVKTCQSSA